MARVVRAEWILNAVERWASDYFVLRETGSVLEHDGRLDMVLVPSVWARPFRDRRSALGLIGVEVKVSRSDFTRGLRTGQYERYRDDGGVTSLYVATPKGLIRTKELPKGVGHLIVNTSGYHPRWSAVCRRKPERDDRPTPEPVLWRLMLQMQERHREAMQSTRQLHKHAMRRVGQVASDELFTAIRRFDERLREGHVCDECSS